MDNEDIYLEGRTAYYDGVPNPYIEGTPEYSKFEEGFQYSWDEMLDDECASDYD